MKKLGNQTVIERRGVNLISRIVTDMGLVWRETPCADAGIDGEIEIRNPETEEMTNCIIKVQSKASERPFQSENDASFSYSCRESDLEYWLSGNVPVILVVSRPSDDVAYWVSIKDYFSSNPSCGKTVRFTKHDTALQATDACRDRLARLAMGTDRGLYFRPPPVTEQLLSNLLPVRSYGQTLFIASTSYRKPGDVYEWARSSGVRLPCDWFLSDRLMYSFNNLRAHPWTEICDRGSCEAFESDEWAQADDVQKVNEFSRLLRLALKQRLWPKVRVHEYRGRQTFYVNAPRSLQTVTWHYRSRKKRTKRDVFQGYKGKRSGSGISYYRHSAFEGQFHRFGDKWHLEVMPTYRFTTDGRSGHGRSSKLLKGIKERELNQAVCGQFLMWADRLQDKDDLFNKTYPFLSFGKPQLLDCPVSLPDRQWLGEDELADPEIPMVDSDFGPLFEGLMGSRQL